MKLIAETAWHHQGDFSFMENLVSEICTNTDADIVKMHISLNLDEYMRQDHPAYKTLKPWLFTKEQWTELFSIVRKHKKELMLLLNDTDSIEFGLKAGPAYVEIHSVCLNDTRMLDRLKSQVDYETKIVLGVGGTDLYEIDYAINYLERPNLLLMFGFQNYPTVYRDVNLRKIRRVMGVFPEFSYGFADHTAWDSPHNELVTLLGAAYGMSFVEKHVTTNYGEERVDSQAAISIDMFNELARKLVVLDELEGDGRLELNQGELDYSVYGPMKKAGVLKADVRKGEVLSKEMIVFIRTKEVSDLSQLDVIKSIGKAISQKANAGDLITKKLVGEPEE